MVLLYSKDLSSSDSEGEEFVPIARNPVVRNANAVPYVSPNAVHYHPDRKEPVAEEEPPIDWEQFKKDHGIYEEVETFKGPGGSIIKKRYLSRSETYEVGYDVGRDTPMSKRQKK